MGYLLNRRARKAAEAAYPADPQAQADYIKGFVNGWQWADSLIGSPLLPIVSILALTLAIFATLRT